MRITFVLPYAGLSGGARVVSIYADRLQKRGHKVTVVSRSPRQLSLSQGMISLLKGDGWPKSQKGAPYFDYLDVELRMTETGRPITESDVPDADVIVATWWETAEWVVNFPEKKGRKFYLIQGHEIFPHLPVDRVKATYKLPFHKIAVSDWLADVLAKEYGCHDVSIVKNSVDTAQFCAPPRTRQTVPTVGFMYSIKPRKNCNTAVEALTEARSLLPNLNAISFGRRYPDKGANFPKWIKFHVRPPQNFLPHLYSQCDVWLFPSTSEGFGLPILEAMACRTPVIASHAGAAPDLIDDGKNGFLVENEPRAFAEKIAEVAKMSGDNWEDISDAAYTTANSYSWDNAAEIFESCLLMDEIT